MRKKKKKVPSLQKIKITINSMITISKECYESTFCIERKAKPIYTQGVSRQKPTFFYKSASIALPLTKLCRVDEA